MATNLVTVDALIAAVLSVEVRKFNECHGADGKFCSTSTGDTTGAGTGAGGDGGEGETKRRVERTSRRDRAHIAPQEADTDPDKFEAGLMGRNMLHQATLERPDANVAPKAYNGLLGGSLSVSGAAKKEVQERLHARLKDNPDFQKLAEKMFSHAGTLNGVEANNRAIQELVYQWANTSCDDSKLSLALQISASEVFGGRRSKDMMSKSNYREGLKLYMRHQKGFDAFIKAQYAETQDFLQKRGIEYVTVVRGARLPNRPVGKYKDWLGTNPLASFTTDFGTAKAFAGTQGKRSIIGATVHRSQILSTPRTGFGCRGEHEVVVIGTRYSKGFFHTVGSGQDTLGTHTEFFGQMRKAYSRRKT
jgi:hypothetical protein